MRILNNIPGIAHIELSENDVVRHRLVKQVIKAYEKESEREEQLEQESLERRRRTVINGE